MPCIGTQPFGVVENVIVAQSMRGRGIGRLLTAYMERLALAHDCTRLMLGQGFDGRTCRYLSVRYEEVKAQVLSGKTDAEVLDWYFDNGRRLTDEEALICNSFMSKRGWHDDESDGFIPEMIKHNGLRSDGSVPSSDAARRADNIRLAAERAGLPLPQAVCVGDGSGTCVPAANWKSLSSAPARKPIASGRAASSTSSNRRRPRAFSLFCERFDSLKSP